MLSKTSAACAALVIAFVLAACGTKEAPPAPPPAAAANDKAEPAEGAPRIAISPEGIHVQYHVYGTGEPALVFIHGWSCDSNYWREQVPAFSRKYTVVTVDLAGHGGTDANRGDWSMEKYGQDVATAVAAVPNRQLILIGHSMGGPVAIEAARLLKNRVIGIVGVDTFKTIGAPLPSAAQLDAILKPFEANFIGHTRDAVAGHFFAPGANPQLVQKIAYDMSLSPPQVAIPSMRAVLSYDFAAPLKDVQVPLVAINSDLGEPVNELRIRKVLPRFHAVVIPGVGHFLMMEDPARFNPALETEVQGILAAQPAAGS
ncbi:MAG TPA: alpha/beta hydrolase [Steroidobacteraceae bacterium]|nr:alpha/beta hydrolase [Steroidobacteraceae bacterium]